MNIYKQYFKKSILISAGIIFFVAIFNLYMDPANLFHLTNRKTDEEKIAELLLDKQNIEIFSNIDDRLIQKYYFNHLREKKDILVLGSSRVLQIRHEFFPKGSFFNCGVSNGSLEDIIAIYQIIKEHDKLPNVMVIGVDPGMVSKNRGNAWESLAEEYYRAMNDMKLETPDYYSGLKLKKAQALISMSYLKESIKMIKNNRIEYFKVTETDKSVNMIRKKDGSRSMDEKTRKKAYSDVETEILELLSEKDKFSFDINDKQILIFESFIKEIKEKNITIVFFLHPFHSYFYQSYIGMDEVENYLLKYAEKNDIVVIGSYDPKKAGVMDTDFYDFLHLQKEGIDTMFRNFEKSDTIK